MGWAWSCGRQPMETDGNGVIDQGHTFDSLLPVMRFSSARGIPDDHGIRSIQCDVYDGRPI